jgi:hypothetical protein
VSFQPYLWPEYEPLFDNPRFIAVLEKFGLPQKGHIPRVDENVLQRFGSAFGSPRGT